MIIRGTTPTMIFGLPFKAELLATAYVTVQQNDTTIFEKQLSDCTCDDELLSVKLTQEDTLSLSSDSKAKIRLVVKTLGGDRLESFPVIESVEDTSKEGVI